MKSVWDEVRGSSSSLVTSESFKLAIWGSIHDKLWDQVRTNIQMLIEQAIS